MTSAFQSHKSLDRLSARFVVVQIHHLPQAGSALAGRRTGAGPPHACIEKLLGQPNAERQIVRASGPMPDALIGVLLASQFNVGEALVSTVVAGTVLQAAARAGLCKTVGDAGGNDRLQVCTFPVSSRQRLGKQFAVVLDRTVPTLPTESLGALLNGWRARKTD